MRLRAVIPFLFGHFLCLEFNAPEALSIAAHPGTKGQIVDQGLVETRGGKGLQNFTAPGVQIFGIQYCFSNGHSRGFQFVLRKGIDRRLQSFIILFGHNNMVIIKQIAECGKHSQNIMNIESIILKIRNQE
jgi:hypothetical protein